MNIIPLNGEACPCCGSTNEDGETIWRRLTQFECMDCGYKWAVVYWEPYETDTD